MEKAAKICTIPTGSHFRCPGYNMQGALESVKAEIMCCESMIRLSSN